MNGYNKFKGNTSSNKQNCQNYGNINLSNSERNKKNGILENNDLKIQNKIGKIDRKVNTSDTNPSFNIRDTSNQDLYNNIIPMEEEEKIQEQQELCQMHLDMQLLLRRQKNYNNTFKNCYNSMKEYLKKPTHTNKGNFLWNLDGCCAIVNLWKKDYPDYEPQFSSEFKKDSVIKEIKNLIQKFKESKNVEHVKIFNKFYQLLNNQKQNLEEDKNILKYFPNNQANENNTISTANNLIGVQRKISQETEKEEFYGFKNYDVDPKIRHLRDSS